MVSNEDVKRFVETFKAKWPFKEAPNDDTVMYAVSEYIMLRTWLQNQYVDPFMMENLVED